MFILLFFFTISSHAVGFGLLEASEKVSDTALMVDSVAQLAEEIGVHADSIDRLIKIEDEISHLDREIRQVDYVQKETLDLVNTRMQQRRQVSRNIRFLTRYIRRIKRLYALIGSSGASGDAATASTLMQTNSLLMQILRNQNDDKSLELQKEIESDRRKLRQAAQREQFLESQLEFIEQHSKQEMNVSFNPFNVVHEGNP